MPALTTILAALALAADPAPRGPGAAAPSGDGVAMVSGPPVSLFAGELLVAGGSQLTGWAGYPSAGFLYLQGFGPLDAGAEMQLVWDTGELTVGGAGRLPLWRAGASALAFRARLGLYLALGPSYGSYAHREDVGLLVAPGLAYSTSAGQATVSLGLDLPFVATSRRGGGTIFAPTLGAAIEAPLAGDVTAGARVSFARRWDQRGAPGSLRSPDDGLELVVLISYRLL